MIPKIVPPLTDLAVLVTRPEPQCGVLCAEIERLGGVAAALPAIVIRPLESAPVEDFDLIVFVSVNAVEHGARLVRKTARTRIAAIGRATAAALAAANLPADIVPEAGFDSEALLARPELAHTPSMRAAIIRGEGGRELLRETLLARGATVEMREVYRRERPNIDPPRLAQIESYWEEDGFDVVTLTSVQTLQHLQEMLSQRGRELLCTTPLLVASRRIADAALAAGLQGDVLLARGADDASMIGALAQWRTRART
ncbi:MAG TPA: uroporphyrinogen-III synthase [Steroidobacter sp.]|jgi:uroporphyrinogen-III synthase|nr:uroporphyrinogen-III synthase [Steroidobacter sp.]